VALSGLSRSAQPPACVLTIEDLRRLYAELDKKASEALEKFLAAQVRHPGTPETDFEQLKQQAREAGRITVTIAGDSGELVVGRSTDVFSAEYLPHRMITVAYDNTSGLQPLNVSLANRLTVTLDLSEAPGFTAYDPWNHPTPNTTRVEVSGTDDTWVSATFQAVLDFFQRRRRRRRWLHGPVSFNLLNWLLIIPGSLWTTFRVDQRLLQPLVDLPTGLRAAADIYLFLFFMLLSRVLIYTVRWMFPAVELEGARSKGARRFLGAIIASLLLTLLYDVLKAIIA
jgi:hypothetical protein